MKTKGGQWKNTINNQKNGNTECYKFRTSRIALVHTSQFIISSSHMDCKDSNKCNGTNYIHLSFSSLFICLLELFDQCVPFFYIKKRQTILINKQSTRCILIRKYSIFCQKKKKNTAFNKNTLNQLLCYYYPTSGTAAQRLEKPHAN